MGALRLESDAPVQSGDRRVVLPLRDDMSCLRFQLLYRLLPPGMTVAQTLTQPEPVEVFNLNGGPPVLVSIDHYTATACLRNLVAEATRGSATKTHARWALNNMAIKPGESWQMAIGRLVAVFRAATVNACLLYTSPSPRDATLSRMPSSA